MGKKQKKKKKKKEKKKTKKKKKTFCYALVEQRRNKRVTFNM